MIGPQLMTLGRIRRCVAGVALRLQKPMPLKLAPCFSLPAACGSDVNSKLRCLPACLNAPTMMPMD